MTKLSYVRIEVRISFDGDGSVDEFFFDRGADIETDGMVLRISKGGRTHLLPFTRVVDSWEMNAHFQKAVVAMTPSIDSKMRGTKKSAPPSE